MTDKPYFIDNIDGNTMSAALRRLLGKNESDVSIVVEPSVTVMRRV